MLNFLKRDRSQTVNIRDTAIVHVTRTQLSKTAGIPQYKDGKVNKSKVIPITSCGGP
jgi:hypothetical protein